MYSKYYQSLVRKDKTWFLTGVLKSEDNLVFVRTIDKKTGRLEYFVPESQETHFFKVMNYLERKGIVSELKEKQNRLR